jgi:NADH-quinone oxidoreductase subunit J
MIEILYLVTLVAAWLSISTKNTVHSVFYLILVFCTSTAIFLSWKVDYLALLLLIIYVGAIAILFLFVVMMLNLRSIELYENQMRYLPIGAILIAIWVLEFSKAIGVRYLSPQSWEEVVAPLSSIERLANLLYTNYLSLVLISGLILFVDSILLYDFSLIYLGRGIIMGTASAPQRFAFVIAYRSFI